MKYHIFILVSLFCLFSCQNITGAKEDSFDQYSEHQVAFSNNVGTQVEDYIIGYSSLAVFTSKDLNKIRLDNSGYTDLVFAVNSDFQPLFASTMSQDNSYLFGSEQTATTITSYFIGPFSNQSLDVLISNITSHESFSTLVERINYLSSANKSFINDDVTTNLLNQIYATFTDHSLKTEVYKPGSLVSYEVTADNSLKVILDSKLPFHINYKDIVREEFLSNKLLSGIPLDSEYGTDPLLSERYTVQNGAHELKLHSNKKSVVERASKLTRDIILKSHILLGLTTKNYQSGNELESFIKSVIIEQDFNSNLTKSETFVFVVNELGQNPDIFHNYFLHRLNLNQKDASPSFLSTIRKMILNQKEYSFLFQDDSFYEEFNQLHEYNSSTTICVESGNEVPCSIDVRKITYSMGQSGCYEDEYKIQFGAGFFAPFGLDTGSKIKINWEFGPAGNAGFWLIGIPDSKLKVNGRTQTTGCFNFGETQELNISISLNDHERRVSNVATIKIDRPKSKKTSTTSIDAYASLIN